MDNFVILMEPKIPTMDDVIKTYFLTILSMCNGNILMTARTLKISRSTAIRYRDKWRDADAKEKSTDVHDEQ